MVLRAEGIFLETELVGATMGLRLGGYQGSLLKTRPIAGALGESMEAIPDVEQRHAVVGVEATWRSYRRDPFL